jgi:pilus assembly protein Flp/PilA
MEMLKFYVKAQTLVASLKDEQGQDMIEYAIMLGIIAVAVIGSVSTVATFVTSKWTALATSL